MGAKIKKISIILLALVTSLGLALPVQATESVLVSGTVKTIDGDLVSGMTISFRPKESNEYSSVRVDALGKFVIQIPEGAYSVSVGTAPFSRSPLCITGEFEKNISKATSSFNVKLPRLKTFEAKFVDEAGTLLHWKSLTVYEFDYKAPENGDVQNASFKCGRAVVQPDLNVVPEGQVLTWRAFESATDELAKLGPFQPRYAISNGIGQDVVAPLPQIGWAEGKFTVVVKDIPKISISAKDLKVVKGKLSGFATFVEPQAFSELGLQRTFVVAIRELRAGKWLSWISSRGNTAVIAKGGRVLLSVDVSKYKGKSIQVIVRGSNFSSGNQLALIKVPK